KTAGVFRANLWPLLSHSEFKFFLSGLKQESRETLHLGLQLLSCAVHGRQTRNRKLASVGVRSPTVHVAFRVKSCAHGNEVRVDVEDIGNDLRRRRLVTLALRTRTHRHNDLAINIQFAVRSLRISGKRRISIDDLRRAR